MFDVSNTDASADKEDSGDRKYRLYVFFEAVCISITSFLEALILLLLCSSSIGQNHFHRSWFTGTYNYRLLHDLLILFAVFGA